MAEATQKRGVELGDQAALRLGEQRLGQRLRDWLGLGPIAAARPRAPRLRGDLLRPLPVRVGDCAEQLPERGSPCRGSGGK